MLTTTHTAAMQRTHEHTFATAPSEPGRHRTPSLIRRLVAKSSAQTHSCGSKKNRLNESFERQHEPHSEAAPRIVRQPTQTLRDAPRHSQTNTNTHGKVGDRNPAKEAQKSVAASSCKLGSGAARRRTRSPAAALHGATMSPVDSSQ